MLSSSESPDGPLIMQPVRERNVNAIKGWICDQVFVGLMDDRNVVALRECFGFLRVSRGNRCYDYFPMGLRWSYKCERT